MYNTDLQLLFPWAESKVLLLIKFYKTRVLLEMTFVSLAGWVGRVGDEDVQVSL